MNKFMKKGTKQNKRFWPTEEDPRYGQSFQLVEIQLENIDHQFTGWIKAEYEDNRLIPIGNTWHEWKKKKQTISDEFCKGINRMISSTPYKDVVALKVHYFGDPRGVYQIV